MATDVEKLVVQLSADFKSYENAMAKASGITRKQLAQIKADAANVGSASGQAFTGATAGVKRYGDSASQAAKQSSALRAQTGNLAAQFQDIAVQLQGGQSPFTIALQQGTQISAVLGGAGAGGAVKALAGAFASLVSPVSLVTIGLIAAGGAAVQYISGLLDDGAKTEEELKKQSALIQQVAKDWGDAVPAVKAYAEEAEKANKAADLRSAGEAVIADIWKPAKEQVKSFGVEIEGVVQTLMTLGNDTTGIANLQSSMANLQDKTRSQSATAEDAQAVLDALNATMANGTPIAGGLADGLAALSTMLGSVAIQAAAAKSQVNGALNEMRAIRAAQAESMAALDSQTRAGQNYIADQERINKLSAEKLTLETETARVKSEISAAGGIATEEQAVKLARERLAAEERRSALAKAASEPSGLEKFRAADAQSMAAYNEAVKNAPGFIADQVRSNALTAEQLTLESEIARVKNDAKNAGSLITDQQALDLAQSRLAAEKRRTDAAKLASDAARSGSGGGAASTDREREAVSKLVEQLQFENSLIGKTALEKERANALRRAGAAATAEERAQIEQLVTTGYLQNEALQQTQDQLEKMRGLSKDVLGGMFEDLRNGASGADLLKNALNRVSESLVKMALDSAFSSSGGLGSSILGSIFGGGGSTFHMSGSTVVGQYHSGGIAGQDGTPRVVNPALFRGARRYHTGGLVPGEVPAILQRGERVLTRGQQAAMGGGTVGVRVYVDQDGNWQAAVAQISGQVSARVVDKRAAGAVARANLRG